MSPLKQKVASLTVAAMAIGAVLVGTAQFAGADSASASGVRDKIVSVAKAEHKKKIKEPGKCDKYFGKGSGLKCASTAWCGAFTKWVWGKAGVKAPTSNPLWATNWGGTKSSAKFKKRGKGKGGNPEPGDVVVYGKPSQSGHVAIVVKVHGNGNIDTIDGNSSNAVRYKKNLNPKTAKAGEDNVHIWGYRKPVASSSKKKVDATDDQRDDDARKDSDDESDSDGDSGDGTEDSDGTDGTDEDSDSDRDSDGTDGTEEDSDSDADRDKDSDDRTGEDGDSGDSGDESDDEESEPAPDDDAPGMIPGTGPLKEALYNVHP